MAEAEQQAFMVHDERRGLIEEYLAKPIPKNWLRLSEDDRKNYLRNTFLPDGMEDTNGNAVRAQLHEPIELRQRISNMEIFVECFGKNPADFNRYKDAAEIAQIMVAIGGWQASREAYATPYGKQRSYVRKK